MARNQSFIREEVLSKALSAFWADGYEAKSIDQLVKATDLNRSSIYNSFGDKHQLLLETLEYYIREVATPTLMKFLASDKPPLDRIRNMLLDYPATLASFPGARSCFVLNCASELANHDDGVKEMINKGTSGTLSAIAGVIKQGQENHEIRNDQSSDLLATFVMMMLNSILNAYSIEDGELTDHKQLVDLVMTNLT